MLIYLLNKRPDHCETMIDRQLNWTGRANLVRFSLVQLQLVRCKRSFRDRLLDEKS